MDFISPESRLVITRPESQADELIKQIKIANPDLNLLHLPLISILPVRFELPDIQFEKAIFISRNAVEHFFHRSSNIAHSYFAVGEPTAKLVDQFTGTTTHYPDQMNADGLVAMDELQSVKGQNILLIKGEGGRSLIYDELSSRGANVSVLDVYRRKLPELSSQKNIINANSASNIWLITSVEAMINLHRILGLSAQPQHQTRVIVSSDRLKEAALNKGFQIVAQSAGATDRQLVQCVKSLFSDQDNT